MLALCAGESSLAQQNVQGFHGVSPFGNLRGQFSKSIPFVWFERFVELGVRNFTQVHRHALPQHLIRVQTLLRLLQQMRERVQHHEHFFAGGSVEIQLFVGDSDGMSSVGICGCRLLLVTLQQTIPDGLEIGEQRFQIRKIRDQAIRMPLQLGDFLEQAGGAQPSAFHGLLKHPPQGGVWLQQLLTQQAVQQIRKVFVDRGLLLCKELAVLKRELPEHAQTETVDGVNRNRIKIEQGPLKFLGAGVIQHPMGLLGCQWV